MTDCYSLKSRIRKIEYWAIEYFDSERKSSEWMEYHTRFSTKEEARGRLNELVEHKIMEDYEEAKEDEKTGGKG